MQATFTGRSDIHTGALADRLKSLKNLNLARLPWEIWGLI